MYGCPCGKKYKHTTSLSSHKKLCMSGCNLNYMDNNNDMVKENEIIDVESIKTKSIVTFNMDNSNNILNEDVVILSDSETIIQQHNLCKPLRFSLNYFLNDKCKNAINFTDFINDLKITHEDFENFGTYGFVEGITRIIVKGLKALDITQRPIHCTDYKREVIYVRQNNVWNKEDNYKKQIKKGIKTIAFKNTKLIPEWREANPSCMNNQSKKNTQYMRILIEAMGAYTKEEDEVNYHKIIRKISKEVTIDRTNPEFIANV